MSYVHDDSPEKLYRIRGSRHLPPSLGGLVRYIRVDCESYERRSCSQEGENKDPDHKWWESTFSRGFSGMFDSCTGRVDENGDGRDDRDNDHDDDNDDNNDDSVSDNDDSVSDNDSTRDRGDAGGGSHEDHDHGHGHGHDHNAGHGGDDNDNDTSDDSSTTNDSDSDNISNTGSKCNDSTTSDSGTESTALEVSSLGDSDVSLELDDRSTSTGSTSSTSSTSSISTSSGDTGSDVEQDVVARTPLLRSCLKPIEKRRQPMVIPEKPTASCGRTVKRRKRIRFVNVERISIPPNFEAYSTEEDRARAFTTYMEIEDAFDAALYIKGSKEEFYQTIYEMRSRNKIERLKNAPVPVKNHPIVELFYMFGIRLPAYKSTATW